MCCRSFEAVGLPAIVTVVYYLDCHLSTRKPTEREKLPRLLLTHAILTRNGTFDLSDSDLGKPGHSLE